MTGFSQEVQLSVPPPQNSMMESVSHCIWYVVYRYFQHFPTLYHPEHNRPKSRTLAVALYNLQSWLVPGAKKEAGMERALNFARKEDEETTVYFIRFPLHAQDEKRSTERT